MKKLNPILLLSIITAIFICGCVNVEQKYYINPDGSGKVEYSSKMKTDFTIGNENETPEAKAKESVKRIMEKSKGIIAWKDVSYELLDNGKMQFTGTAYFRDISKFEIDSGIKAKGMSPVFEKRPDGDYYLALVNKEKSIDEQDTILDDLSEKEITKRIINQKANFKQSLMMMNMFLPEFSMKMSFCLPGKIKKSVNFSKSEKNDHSVALSYDGEKLLKVLSDIAEDDNFWRETVVSGINIQKDGPPVEEINEKLFGFRSIPEASIAGDSAKPLFDFKAEVKEAQGNYEKMLLKLGLSSDISLPAANGDGFKKLYVGGVRLVRTEDEENSLRPFNWTKGYTLSVIGEFPGAVMSVKEGEVITALTDSGQSLLPERDWDRKVSFPRLSDDKSSVIFEVKLNIPSEDVKYLKEISGNLNYITASGEEKIDLGYLECKAGAKASKFDATIESITASDWPKNSTNLQFKIFLSADTVKNIKFYDVDGIELKFTQNGYSYSNRSTSFTYNTTEKIPEKVKIVIEKHSKLKKFEIPFKLENISLLGIPIK